MNAVATIAVSTHMPPRYRTEDVTLLEASPRPGLAPDRIERPHGDPLSSLLAQRAHGVDDLFIGDALGDPFGSATALAATTPILRDVGAKYPSLDLRAIERGGAGQPHTLGRHVGKSDAELRERLATERVSASSTYATLASAQQSTDFVIGASDNQSRIENWLKGGAKGTLLLDGSVPGEAIGRVMSRADGAAGRSAVATSDAQVVLKADPTSPAGYTVLSSYPTKS